ncbi:ArsR family transcriptional regulator [Candidatus Woesearchaeota archaeon]|nr:ArsR family transcriptional regulator [Candidatus Woesearchaeota archaeon]
METLYSQLKANFGLKDKHVLIMKALYQHELRAEDICKATHIPQGRIYDYLNFLVENGLVERSHKKPFLYSIKDLRKSVIWFTKQKIDGMVQSQDEIIGRFKDEAQSSFSLITDSAVFTKTHCDLITKSKIFRVLAIHRSFPYMLYPENLQDFVAVRKLITSSRPTITTNNSESILLVYRCYMDAFHKGKKMTCIMERETFDKHLKLFEQYFPPDKLAAILQDIVTKLKKYGAEVFVIDEYSAMQTDFNEKEVCLCVNYSGITNGFHTRSKELASFFNRVFMEKMKRADPVLPLLEKKLGESLAKTHESAPHLDQA